MSEHDELQQKIADIGYRYLQRTLGELGGLRELIVRVGTGDVAAVGEVQRLAHKVYGSGSMFGFETVSERAHALELAALDPVDESVAQRLETCALALDEAVRAAAHARGIQ